MCASWAGGLVCTLVYACAPYVCGTPASMGCGSCLHPKPGLSVGLNIHVCEVGEGE